jgi:hypothetical protein
MICMYATDNEMCTRAALSNSYAYAYAYMTERYWCIADSPTARSREETGINTPKGREGGTTNNIPTPRDVSSRLTYVWAKWVWDGMSMSVSGLRGGQHANFGRALLTAR